MSSEEHPIHRKEHFARIRRTKLFLRFMPRRARLHKYPLVGRFADAARKRSYLWSFKTPQVRPALYIGSILAFMPIFVGQLPIAFLLSFFLRLNIMVMGGLQFITNPFVAPGIYYGTYRLGSVVIEASGLGHGAPPAPVVIEIEDPVFVPDGPLPVEASPASPAETSWLRRVGATINAFVIGGVIVGTLTGGLLDLLWRLGAGRAAAYRARSHSTGESAAPK